MTVTTPPPGTQAPVRSGPERPARVRSARVRLFVALELPLSARDALVERTAAWMAGGRGRLHPIAAADLHVTLCFLGDQPASAIDPITEALGSAVAGIAPLRATLGAPVWLPRRRPRVLAVQLSAGADGAGGADALNVLQARVATALVTGGWYAPERRPFLAHVTVARVRGGDLGSGVTDGADVPGGCSPGARDVSEGRFEAGEVALIRSRLGAGPVRYERVAVWALAPPG